MMKRMNETTKVTTFKGSNRALRTTTWTEENPVKASVMKAIDIISKEVMDPLFEEQAVVLVSECMEITQQLYGLADKLLDEVPCKQTEWVTLEKEATA